VWLVMVVTARARYPRYEMALAPLLVLFTVAPWRLWPGARKAWKPLVALAGVGCLVVSLSLVMALEGPRPQNQALKRLVAQAQPDESIGVVGVPWFFHPPLLYYNGGQGLLGNRLWSEEIRPVRPVQAFSVESGLAQPTHTFGAGPDEPSDPPAYFVTTSFTVGEGLAADDPATVTFIEELKREYRVLEKVGGGPGPVRALARGHDWYYPWPEITLWKRVDDS
jgi:hypothetical protein